jgi:hypothetical protein
VTLSGLVARYADAWNARDPRGCAECFAPDGERVWHVLAPHLPGDPFPRFRGRRAIEEAIAAFMAALPDVGVDVLALSDGSDGRIWTEWRLTGTHLGDLGPWAAQGERVDVVGVSIFTVTGRGFAEERVYWDNLLMMGAPRAAPAASALP